MPAGAHALARNEGNEGNEGEDTMAVTQWRPLEDYHPAVRLMVRYMWRQEPPLLPSGFADRMGLARQLVSRWLQVQEQVGVHEDAASPSASAGPAAIPLLPGLTPSLAVRLARAMGLAPTAVLRAAGHCSEEEPLFAVEDAWDYVIDYVAAHARATPDAADNTTGSAEEMADTVRQALQLALQRARDVDVAQRATHWRRDNVRTADSDPPHAVASDGHSPLPEAMVATPTETVQGE